jgi:hypothetical protein
MIFQSPGLLSILSHLQIYPLIDLVSTNRKSRVIENISPIVRIKNPKGLTVRVDISSMEVSSLHSEAVKASINENAKNKYQYYKAYLRQLIPGSEDNYDKIIKKIRTWNQTIQHSIDNPDFNDVIMVDRLIEKNNYVSKNTKRPGLIVKLFRTYYMTKMYLSKHTFMTRIVNPSTILLRKISKMKSYFNAMLNNYMDLSILFLQSCILGGKSKNILLKKTDMSLNVYSLLWNIYLL